MSFAASRIRLTSTRRSGRWLRRTCLQRKDARQREHDLKSGELLGHVKEAAQEVADTSKQSLRSQIGAATDERA